MRGYLAVAPRHGFSNAAQTARAPRPRRRSGGARRGLGTLWALSPADPSGDEGGANEGGANEGDADKRGADKRDKGDKRRIDRAEASRRARRAAEPAGALGLEIRLRPLSREYWPEPERRPYLRLALGLLASTSPVFLITLTAAFLLYRLEEGTFFAAWAMTQATAADLAPAFLLLTFGGAAPAFALLWSLRLTRRTAFAAAGAIIGVGATIALEQVERGVTPAAALYLTGAGAATMLCLRWIAGVRKTSVRPWRR
ncbi:MAG: hypothetical protein AAGM38_14185 [Pseudomonadota bacterium]